MDTLSGLRVQTAASSSCCRGSVRSSGCFLFQTPELPLSRLLFFRLQEREGSFSEILRMDHDIFSVHHVRNLYDFHLGQILHGPFQIPEPGTPFVRADPELDLCIHLRRSLRDCIVISGPEDVPDRLIAVTFYSASGCL